MTIPESARELLESCVRERLTPQKSHAGYDQLLKRYVVNGHLDRLIESYSRIAPFLTAAKAVCILGASPVEGFLLRELAPEARVDLLGSPERLRYRSRDDYQFSRSEELPEGATVFPVVRHNIEGPLPAADGSYEVVICLETIEHLRRDPLAALCEMRRVITDGGCLFLSTPNLNSARAVARALDWESPLFFPSFGPPPFGIVHAHEYSVCEQIALLSRAGFEISDLSSFNHRAPPPFDHDRAYRSRQAIPETLLDRLNLPRTDTRTLLSAIEGQPLRGDYLFVRAAAAHQPDPHPFAPLFCTFD